MRDSLRGLLLREVPTVELWRGTQQYDNVGKLNDLIFRFLHRKVRTGSRLTWVASEKQTCPWDGCDQTIQHLWIDCEIARTAWDLFSTVWAAITHKPPPLPRNEDQLIGLLAVAPFERRAYYHAVRWRLLFNETVWVIWKAYLRYQFDEEPDFRPDKVRDLVWLTYNRLAHREQFLAQSSRHRTFRRHNAGAFAKIWGTSPASFNRSRHPQCLHASRPGGASIDPGPRGD